ncbi:MAG TPA: hypothetical protein DDZ80_05355 [Cyanobacteria bacterium UBA8803]|nr:hypothetical protein [Cyanobacteria bacterium UBA9273]HBL57971.1 hypothetical protein [Cyanobacteria bacterium UBA8803]
MSIRHGKILGMFSLTGSLGAIAALTLALPTPAWAQPRQINLTIGSENAPDFETLMQQAQSQAENAIQQAFAESPEVTEVSITIIGERNGLEVPLLSSSVARASWQKEPTVGAGTIYFQNAEILLGFIKLDKPSLAAPSAPAFNPVAASMADIEPNFYR